MTQNDIRRKALRKEESLFRLQAPYLRRLGGTRAAQTADDDTADALRDLDLLVWDETEFYLSSFASDPTDAPYMVTDLLPRTARRGRQLGIEVELPPLVAALTCIRIWAGGDDVYARHRPLCFAIMNSQDSDPRYKPLFERFCQEIEANKYDPRNHEEVDYRRGDPMERLKDTDEENTNAKTEALLGQILEATKGWNQKAAFAAHWEQWTALWRHLLEHDEMAENVAQKRPKSAANTTTINMTLVCNVAGLLKGHLESKRRIAVTDKKLAELIQDSWKADSCRSAIATTSELAKEPKDQINGWLAINIK